MYSSPMCANNRLSTKQSTTDSKLPNLIDCWALDIFGKSCVVTDCGQKQSIYKYTYQRMWLKIDIPKNVNWPHIMTIEIV